MSWISRSCTFGVLAAILAFIWSNTGHQDIYTEIKMPDDIEAQRDTFRQMGKTAFVLGYTGEVGKELVKELLKSKVFSRVTLIGRRVVNYEDELYKDIEQKMIDFDKTDGDEYAETFRGYDVGFSCLGTTRGKAGADGFYRVDHDYVMNTAKLALSGGCKHFHLVSSKGANINSSLLYPKTKGQVEEELKQMGFERLSIYRPGMLMCDREESRPMESVARFFMKPLEKLCPTVATTPTSSMGKAMLNCAVIPSEEKIELYDIKGILRLAGEYNK